MCPDHNHDIIPVLPLIPAQMVVHSDDLFLYGGHSVAQQPDGSELETVFDDMWRLDLKTFEVCASIIYYGPFIHCAHLTQNGFFAGGERRSFEHRLEGLAGIPVQPHSWRCFCSSV